MKKRLKKILGDPQAKTLKRLQKRVKEINAHEPAMEKLSESDLKAQTKKFKDELAANIDDPVQHAKDLDRLLPEVFATVREVAKRVLGQRHFEVQLIGGMAMHEGMVAEMKTGEGKTLVATLPLYLNALSAKGSHLVTVNDYLVKIGAGWMGEIYTYLGVTVGVIIPDQSFIYDTEYTDDKQEEERFKHLRPCSRQEAYRADITYGTNNEFGFDYLRDNMVREESQLRLRELHFAIVDEVDSILIDEARTPLIISAPAATSGSSYEQFSKISRQLKRDTHFEVDEKRKAVTLTNEGIDFVEKTLGISNLYDTKNIRTIYHLDQALRAEALFRKDKDYVITKEGEVVIVDEFTGRLLAGRRYNEGLHQAIEAKESVEIQEESMTLATVTFQNFFRLYAKLAGMTGTAATEAEEFQQIYELEVLEVPSNRLLARVDRSDKIFRTKAGKYAAIVREVKEMQDKGQPVLIGSSAIEHNEEIGRLLKKAGVPFQMLNAKNNEREASIVEKAGQRGAVTLATNIAGRGTDIVLGKGVQELGGLFVLGSERHESRRIDNQLRGRAGRQGDPGGTQFYVSTEDDLMRVFGGERISKVMDRLKIDDETPIQNRVISKSLEGAQKKVEGFNYDSRKNVVQYDDVMNRHRRATYIMRREILKHADISNRIKEFILDESRALVSAPESMDEQFETILKDIFDFDNQTIDTLFEVEAEKFEKVLSEKALRKHSEQTELFGEEIMNKVERDIFLQVLDNLWMQHLESMDHLRQGINWMSVGQRDPLVEYRRQSQLLFEEMQAALRHDTIRALFHARPVSQDKINNPIETELTRAAKGSVDNADKVMSSTTRIDDDNFALRDDVSATKVKVSTVKKKQKRKAAKKVRAQQRKRK
jgi:preprotein translocase subunit SecA